MDRSMKDDQIANALAALATRVADGLRKGAERAAKRGSKAPTALVLISGQPGQSIDELRKALGLSHSGTVRLVEKLVQDGLVTKQQGMDARTVALRCTAAGLRRARGIVKARKNVIDEVISVLSKDEKNHLEAILRKIPAARIDPENSGPSPISPGVRASLR